MSKLNVFLNLIDTFSKAKSSYAKCGKVGRIVTIILTFLSSALLAFSIWLLTKSFDLMNGSFIIGLLAFVGSVVLVIACAMVVITYIVAIITVTVREVRWINNHKNELSNPSAVPQHALGVDPFGEEYENTPELVDEQKPEPERINQIIAEQIQDAQKNKTEGVPKMGKTGNIVLLCFALLNIPFVAVCVLFALALIKGN